MSSYREVFAIVLICKCAHLQLPGAIRPRAISGAIQSNVRKDVHATVQESIAQGDQVDRAIVHKVFRTIANDPSGTVFSPIKLNSN